MVLRNGLGEPITVTSLKIEDCTGAVSGSLADGAQGTFAVSGCVNAVGSSSRKDIALNYTSASGIVHTINGLIVGQVEQGVGDASDFEICTNADANSLCDGLDIVYGEGFRANCQTTWGLC
jgi:hypothetical protein